MPCRFALRSGLPMPHRRTFAAGILPFAHSMLTSLSPSMAALVSNAGFRARAAPRRLHVAQVGNLCVPRSTGFQPVSLSDSRFIRDGERVSLHGPWKAVQAYRGLEGRVFAFVSHLGWATEGVSLHGPWKAVQASPQQQ